MNVWNFPSDAYTHFDSSHGDSFLSSYLNPKSSMLFYRMFTSVGVWMWLTIESNMVCAKEN